MDELMRCGHCGEAIGVYEPLVLVDGRATRLTSRAAEPALSAEGAKRYHVACHGALHGRVDAEEEG